VKKVEIHVFPDKTSGSKSYKLSLTTFIAAIACVVFSVVGFIIFSPDRIIDNLSNGNALAVFRQNKAIKKEIKEIRESVDESILKAEETKVLRDSTVYKGGLGFLLEENAVEAARAGMPRKSLNEVEATFRKLEMRLMQDSALAACIPVIHPLKNGHSVKNRFEMIYDPFTEQELPHRGIDYVAAVGDTVYATGGGTVSEVRGHRGFGLSMKIEHKPKIRTFYAHLGKALVKAGDKVRRGQPIALIGESGRESSVGLHYEIRVDGVPVNPEDYFITK
jgi:murein DD-endopeptidase MepM/ murein hydrolase activator NlpD